MSESEPKFPTHATLHYEDGTEQMVLFAKAKPSKQGKLNAYGGGKIIVDGNRFQCSFNVTKIGQ